LRVERGSRKAQVGREVEVVEQAVERPREEDEERDEEKEEEVGYAAFSFWDEGGVAKVSKGNGGGECV
jgi:hypothetical protein